MEKLFSASFYYSTNDLFSAENIIIFLAVFFIIDIIIIIVALAVKKSRESADKAQPVCRERAKIVDKQQLPPNAIVMSSTLIWILAELENGQRLRLNVKAQSGLVVGDTGYLTWQGSRVRNFERDK